MKAVDYGTVQIPELDEAVRTHPRRKWSDEELAIVNSYYVDTPLTILHRYLAEHFSPGRSKTAINTQAERMGLMKPRKKMAVANPK